MIYNKYFSKESLGKLYISFFWQWATKGLHLKSTGGCVPEGCGLNRFVRRGNYSSPKGSQLSSWLLPKQSVSEQWWNYRADLWSTAPKLPELESYRMFIMRPGRHGEQSAPTAGNVTSRRGCFLPPYSGHWWQFWQESPPVQDPWGLRAGDCVERFRDFSLGGWNPSFANHWLGEENHSSLICCLTGYKMGVTFLLQKTFVN